MQRIRRSVCVSATCPYLVCLPAASAGILYAMPPCGLMLLAAFLNVVPQHGAAGATSIGPPATRQYNSNPLMKTESIESPTDMSLQNTETRSFLSRIVSYPSHKLALRTTIFQDHLDVLPVVAILKDRVSCSGDGDRVGRLVDVSRYHA